MLYYCNYKYISCRFLSPLFCLLLIVMMTNNTCSVDMYVLHTDIFRNYFKDHAHEFTDAPPLQGGEEHNLRYYSLFMDYLAIYEVRALPASLPAS
jgi:hypothetical protein